ncbi:MAG TPA: (2Fe-2S)-binding protein [Thermomicrobiales bacterium]|nr:(2Fe-2S)-binding protein [Thermomicrobiales bacterium]
MSSETISVSTKVNGTEQTIDVEPRTLLVHMLRENLNLTGTHTGCETGQCGACTVLMDGRAVKSCMVLAAQAEGREVTTIEALAESEHNLHPLQEAFWEEHGVQCGYCTPGMILSTLALLSDTPHPDEGQIRHAIEGNICRCTGYNSIVKAVQVASERLGADDLAVAGTKAEG